MEPRFLNENVKEGWIQPELNFKTSMNADGFVDDNEVNLKPSLTVPGQSMSVREIMSRYANGLEVRGVKVPIWEDEGALPDPKSMDLVDRQEFRIAAEQELLAYKAEQAAKGYVKDAPKSPKTAGDHIEDADVVAEPS